MLLKIKIAYQPEESEQARAVAAMLRPILGDVRINNSDNHKPFLHMYISTRRPATGKALQKP